jgi:hypothetical protein
MVEPKGTTHQIASVAPTPPRGRLLDRRRTACRRSKRGGMKDLGDDRASWRIQLRRGSASGGFGSPMGRQPLAGPGQAGLLRRRPPQSFGREPCRGRGPPRADRWAQRSRGAQRGQPGDRRRAGGGARVAHGCSDSRFVARSALRPAVSRLVARRLPLSGHRKSGRALSGTGTTAPIGGSSCVGARPREASVRRIRCPQLGSPPTSRRSTSTGTARPSSSGSDGTAATGGSRAGRSGPADVVTDSGTRMEHEHDSGRWLRQGQDAVRRRAGCVWSADRHRRQGQRLVVWARYDGAHYRIHGSRVPAG